MTRKTIEQKTIMGYRAMNSDGFEYPYGKYKFGENTRSESIKRQIRNDKRSIRAKEDARIKAEELGPIE